MPPMLLDLTVYETLIFDILIIISKSNILCLRSLVSPNVCLLLLCMRYCRRVLGGPSGYRLQSTKTWQLSP